MKDLVRGLVLRYSYGVWLTPKGGKLMQAFVEDALPRLEKALAAAPEDMELAAVAADLYSRLAEMLGSQSVATPDGDVEVLGRLAPPPGQLYQLGEPVPGPIRQNIDLAAFRVETGLRVIMKSPAWPSA